MPFTRPFASVSITDMALILIILITLLLGLPETAAAWGPATHLEIGSAILNNTRHIAPAIASLIEAYPYDFLYGNISADVVVGKNLVTELKHCHNWKVGFKMLRLARGDSQKAFAYGYLSHLAADTVAHNHFIPEMMIRSFSARTLRHIYWEMRFDSLADKRVWQLPKKMVKEIHVDNDSLMDAVIEGTPLSFRTNKTIFSGLMNLQKIDQWHRMLALLSIRSKWAMHKEDKVRYHGASIDAITGLLANPQKAACLKKDPTGRHSLSSAMFIRKRLLTIKKSGKDWEAAMENALKWVRVAQPGE